jgi:hypothetical protein
MIIGNITLSSKPDSESLRSGMVCASCLCECEEVPVDNSFDDQFGLVTVWDVGSDCCGADCFEGKVFLDSSSTHTARKDHTNKAGKVIVQAGQRYRAHIIKGYYVEDGEHKGICEYSKTLLKQQ